MAISKKNQIILDDTPKYKKFTTNDIKKTAPKKTPKKK